MLSSSNNTSFKDIFTTPFNGYLILISILTALAGYGQMAFTMLLAGDDWAGVISGSYLSKFVLMIGRWNHYFLGKLFDDRIFSPSFSFFLLALSIGIAALIYIHLFKIKNKVHQVIFIALCSSFPIWFEAYLFNIGRLPKCLALISGACGALLLANSYLFSSDFKLKKIGSYIAGLLLLVLTTGCYQVYLFIPVLALLIYAALRNYESTKEAVAIFVKILVSLLIVVILYYIITKSLTFIYAVEMHTSGRYGITFSAATIVSNFTTAIGALIRFYTKSQMNLPLLVKLIGLASILFFLINEFILKKTKGAILGIKVLLFLGAILVPWSIGFIKGEGAFRLNSLVSLCLSYTFFFVYLLKELKGKRRYIYNTLLTLGIGIIIVFTFKNSASTYAKYLSNKRDMALSSKLLDHIHSSDNYSANPQKLYKVYFIGANPYTQQSRPFDIEQNYDSKVTNLMNIGIWDGQIGRIKHAFYLLGEKGKRFKFYAPSSAKTAEAIEIFNSRKSNQRIVQEIKNWPHESSVISLADGRSFFVVFDKKALD